MSTKTISATAARRKLYELLDDVENFGTQVAIIHKGKAKAVMVHPEEYASWEKAVELSGQSTPAGSEN